MQKSWLRHIFMYILIFLAGIYILLGAFLYLFQRSLIYFPQKEINSTPHDIGLSYDAVSFRAADGVTLEGWFVAAENARGVVLFCHGNAGNISDRLQSIEVFNRLRLSVFIFDYRGYGQSEGRTTEQGTYRDAEGAWDYLVNTRQIAAESIIIFGRSMGGAVAAWLAQDRKPGGLICESTFTSVPDLAARYYPFFPVRLLARYRYSTKDYLHRVRSPVLVIHSCDDDIVPFKHGLALYEAANEPKQFFEIRGDHNSGFLLSEDTYIEGLDAFISKYLGE